MCARGLRLQRAAKTMGNYCCGCLSTDDSFTNRVGDAPAARLANTTDSAVEIKAGLCNADPITKQGKRVQMAQMLCIPLVPIIILVVQACLSLADSITSKVSRLITTSPVALSRISADRVRHIASYIFGRRRQGQTKNSRESVGFPVFRSPFSLHIGYARVYSCKLRQWELPGRKRILGELGAKRMSLMTVNFVHFLLNQL